MAQCEVFQDVFQHTAGGQNHMTGLNSVYNRRGPASIVSPFAQAVLHNVRQATVMRALLTRKSDTLFSSPAWIAAAEQTPTSSVKLTTTALAIGGTLERANPLLATKKRKEVDVFNLLADLVHLEGELNNWLIEFYELTGGEGAPYQLVDISQFPSFEKRCETVAHVVPRVLDFPTFLSATTHACVWVCLLPVRVAITQVAKLHPYPLLRPSNQDTILVAAVDETADNLCRSTAFLSSKESSSAGILACGGPLHFAATWSERRQDQEDYVWCDVVRRSLQQNLATGDVFSLNIHTPILTWWMLPEIFTDAPRFSMESVRQ